MSGLRRTDAGGRCYGANAHQSELLRSDYVDLCRLLRLRLLEQRVFRGIVREYRRSLYERAAHFVLLARLRLPNGTCVGGACSEALPGALFTALLFNIGTQRGTLLAGVGSTVGIHPNSTPGFVGMFDARAFPVVMNGDRPVVAASLTNSGRIVAFGHPDFLSGAVLTANASTARLVDNTLRWAGQKTSPRVLVLVNHEPASLEQFQFLKGRGFQVTRAIPPLTASALSGIDVVTLLANDDRTEGELRELENFNINGGGVLAAGVGWSWTDAQRHASDLPANRLLSRVGLGFVQGYGNRSPFAVQTNPSSLSNGVVAYNWLRTATVPPATAAGRAASADIRRIQGYVRDAVALLSQPSPLRTSLQAAHERLARHLPDGSNPRDPADQPFRTLGLMYLTRRPAVVTEIRSAPRRQRFPVPRGAALSA